MNFKKVFVIIQVKMKRYSPACPRRIFE